jgi:hypothetical protein
VSDALMIALTRPGFALACHTERVVPTGLVPQELVDEAYQYLLYQANGLAGNFKGTNNGMRPPSFRVHARTPKVVTNAPSTRVSLADALAER